MTIFNEDLSYDEARGVKDVLSSLFDHPGWALLLEFIDTRVELRKTELIQLCPESVEQMVKYARMRGGLDELELLPAALHDMHSNASTFLDTWEEDEQIETESGMEN